MIHLFKNLNFGGLLALIAGVVLMVSWTGANHADEATWYEITVTDLTDPNEETNQRIDRVYPSGAPSGSCNTSPGVTCAVLLDGELDENQLPMTVAAADILGFEVLDHRQKQD